MNTFIINNNRIKAPEGIILNNYLDEEEPRFKSYKVDIIKKPLKWIVLHETSGNTASRCKETLLNKGLGVQLILERNGILSQHGDLFLDRMYHASILNNQSIGIEVVNPYAPSLMGKNLYRRNTIPAEWWTWCPDKLDRRYVLPTQEQLKTLEKLIPFLCVELSIPYIFPTIGLNKTQRKVNPSGFLRRLIPESGIVAHQDFASHADGRYLVEYLYPFSCTK
jgi:hypothetical protein